MKFVSPIERFFYFLANQSVPYLKFLGVTPNQITWLSFTLGLLGIYCMQMGHIVSFAVLYSLSYWFDCVDGAVARALNLESKFGDWLDHITDCVQFLIFGLVFANRYVSDLHPLYLAFSAGLLVSFLVYFIGWHKWAGSSNMFTPISNAFPIAKRSSLENMLRILRFADSSTIALYLVGSVIFLEIPCR